MIWVILITEHFIFINYKNNTNIAAYQRTKSRESEREAITLNYFNSLTRGSLIFFINVSRSCGRPQVTTVFNNFQLGTQY